MIPVRVSAIIPSAGSGTRMKASLAKQFLPLGGMPVLCHTLSVFERCPAVTEIIVVLSRNDMKLAEETIFKRFPFRKISKVVEGGPSRMASVSLGLKAVSPGAEIVVIHDGCRPFVTEAMITESVAAAKINGGAVVAIPLLDSLKKTVGGRVAGTIPREGLWRAQTPQAFRAAVLREAYEAAIKSSAEATDDASLLERLGMPVAIVNGSEFNIKITVPEDLVMGEMILKRREKESRRGQRIV